MAQRRRDQGPSAVDAKFPFHSPTPFLKCSDKLYFLDCFLDFFFFLSRIVGFGYTLWKGKKKTPFVGKTLLRSFTTLKSY